MTKDNKRVQEGNKKSEKMPSGKIVPQSNGRSKQSGDIEDKIQLNLDDRFSYI